MTLDLYYLLLIIYGVFLLVALFYYLRRPAPRGDASVGWALGVFYTAALAGVIVVAGLLRHYPGIGLIVLSFPLIFLAWPQLRRFRTNLYVHTAPAVEAPPLTLFFENNTPSKLHVKVESWFGSAKSHHSTLFHTLDYYLEPLEKTSHLLDAFQTRLLAHKSRFVCIMTYELVIEQHQGQSYIREIQPCMQYFNENIEAFRSGTYTVTINPINSEPSN